MSDLKETADGLMGGIKKVFNVNYQYEERVALLEASLSGIQDLRDEALDLEAERDALKARVETFGAFHDGVTLKHARAAWKRCESHHSPVSVIQVAMQNVLTEVANGQDLNGGDDE